MRIKTHPVQTGPLVINQGKQSRVSTKVSMAAYEVYCALYGAQESMVTGGCRGGFGPSELIAFLYAKGFPRNEWKNRFDEAMDGMENL